MTQVIFHQSDNLIELIDLTDVVNGNFVTTATVTVTLIDKDGTNVVGEAWPLAMPYIALTNATYRVIFKDSLTLVPGDLYRAVINADDGANRQAHWEFPIRAETRTGAPC